MRAEFTEKFDEIYHSLPSAVRRGFDKQLRYLLINLRHPSLRAKKYDETNDVWQARVDGHYRFYFRIHGDTYEILNLPKHKD